jgi:hypothetical protein
LATISLSLGSHRASSVRRSWSAALFCLVLITTASAQTSVLTYHNDISRTGQNIAETVLTPASVSSGRFGKLFAQHVDGDVYAQPLYVSKLAIPGKATHNVVFVATEADSLYAFDADSTSGSDAGVLWHVSLLDAAHGATTGATAVDARSDLRCGTIAPQVGITATPVIDPTHGTLYVEAFSNQHGTLIHRLHALDIATGVERKGSPVTVSAPTEGEGKIDIPFNPVREIDRAGVLLSRDRVYVAYGSGCDRPVYQGWMFAYDALTLAARGAFVTAREHGKAAIWMSGAAPGADTQGNVFLATGDGWFDTASPVPLELGDSILKITPHASGLTLADYFTPFNQLLLARHDGDLGSGGVLLLPDQPGGHPHVLVEAGKNGTIYVVDRDTLTAGNLHYCADCTSDRQIVQELPAAITGGVWGTPVYSNNTVYISGSEDILRAFALRDGHLQSAPVSASKDLCDYPGCGLSLSANGDHDGILWALQVGGSDVKEPSILKAYDARDLSRILYTSGQHPGRDAPGGALKFIIPTIANGRVYVGGARQLSVFGLNTQP